MDSSLLRDIAIETAYDYITALQNYMGECEEDYQIGLSLCERVEDVKETIETLERL